MRQLQGEVLVAIMINGVEAQVRTEAVRAGQIIYSIIRVTAEERGAIAEAMIHTRCQEECVLRQSRSCVLRNRRGNAAKERCRRGNQAPINTDQIGETEVVRSD